MQIKHNVTSNGGVVSDGNPQKPLDMRQSSNVVTEFR
jgi:hypothetical protein